MSHIVAITTEMKDAGVLQRTCKRLNLRCSFGLHEVYSTSVRGWGVELPNWRFPVVQRENGELHYDNYRGSWGEISELEKLTQEYAVTVSIEEHAEIGMGLQERIELENSAVQLVFAGL